MARRLTVEDLYAQLRAHQESEDVSSEEEDEESNGEDEAGEHDNENNELEEGNVDGDNVDSTNNGDDSSSNSTTLEELEREEFEAWWSLREAAVNGEDRQNGGITLDSVRDGVVGQGTLGSYIGDIVAFLLWTNEHETEWLTHYGKGRLRNITRQRPGEAVRQRNKRVKLQVRALLREAENNPLIHLEAITAERFMNYVMSLRQIQNGGYLSKSAYGNKRSALFHLYRAHNKLGFPESFRLRLGNLYRGFFRQLQQQNGNGNSNGNNSQGNPSRTRRAAHKEGKDAMSVSLYRSLCEWFLNYGTVDGVFAYCFLVLTWNLACRSNNTALILFNQISWASCFDCFEVFFGHTKTDQTGEDAKYPRHIYANANDPLVCPLFALALYFSCCFETQQELDGPLFPGNDQHQRFSKMLARCIVDHQEQVFALGFLPRDLGTHSIRKGAISYLASLVGGPPAASICIRAGWTMGRVRDIYMRYVSSGDQFCGRCLALLPILDVGFAVSPPFFTDPWEEYGDSLRLQQFPMVGDLGSYRRMTLMCLAALFHHRTFIGGMQANHVARVCSIVWRESTVVEVLDGDEPVVCVTFPWNDRRHAFSGIPPHVKVLQELSLIRNEQKEHIDTFVRKVKQAIDESGLTGSGVTESRLQSMFNSFARDLRQELDGLVLPQGARRGKTARERVETGRGYQWHYFDGKYHRVPKDWRFPRVGVFNAWRQWWIGDTVRNVPPIRSIKPLDLKFLDDIPLSAAELHGRTGINKNRRRPARKIYGDLKYLMDYITRKVVAAGAMQEEITETSVKQMFDAVGEEFQGGRNAQKGWQTVVAEVRKREHRNRAQQH